MLRGRSARLFRLAAASFPLPLLLPAALLIGGIGSTGWYIAKHNAAVSRREAEAALTSISELKAKQLESWMKERRGDAAVIRSSAVFQQLLASPRSSTVQALARDYLRDLQQAYDYDLIAVFDAEGMLLQTTSADGLRRHSCVAHLVQSALRAEEVVLVDFHRGLPGEPIHLSLLCPIQADPPTNKRAAGVVLLLIDPYHFLYPFVQSWPVPSHTAETLLVRREGEEVLYLNETRHRQHTALSLRIPLDRTEVPAVRAARGESGLMTGRDYRGVPVVAVAQAIAGTPWSMVTKIDAEQIDGPIRRDTWTTAIVVGLASLAAWMTLGQLWRRQKLRFMQQELTERQRTEAALRAREEIFSSIVNQAMDAIVLVDGATGGFVEFNPAAHEGLGYTREEFARLSIADIQAEHSPEQIRGNLDTIRQVGGLAFETRHRHRNGELRDVRVSARALYLQGRDCMTAMWSDITESKRAERLVRESEARFRALFDQAVDGIMLLTGDGTELHVNPAFARMHGYDSPSEMESMALGDVDPRASTTEGEQRLRRLMAGEDSTFEVEHYRKDGSIFPLSVSASRVELGGQWYALAFHRDITERRRQEAYRAMAHAILLVLSEPGELRLAFQRVLALVKGSTGVDAVGLRLRDGDDFPYVLSEGFSAEFLQRESSVLCRMPDGTVCPDAAGRASLECLCGLVLEGRTDPGNPLFTPGGSAWTNDTSSLLDLPAGLAPRWHPRNECFRQGYASVALIPIRAKGRITGLLQLSRQRKGHFTGDEIAALEDAASNIGEALLRKRAEVELQESQEQFRQVIAAAQDAIIMIDPHGRIRLWNEAAARIFGFSPSEAIGQSAHVLLAPERFLQTAEQGIADFRQTGTGAAIGAVNELVGRRKDGTEFPVELSLAALLLGDGWHAVGILRDITARKQAAEMLRQRNEELVRFTYTVSHDLKSPLVTIQTFLGYLEKDLEAGDAERIKTDFGYIRRAAAKMLELLEELLELSRVGRKMNPPEDVPFVELVRAAQDAVAGPIAERQVDVRLASVPLLLHGDRRRLTEVLQNLLDNAVKFLGDQPAPRVEIGAEESGREWVFYVRDNGLGIDPRHQGKLFGLFEKLHPGTPGSGMGLALVKRIIEVHGGRIWAESAGPGQGATFYFTVQGTKRC